MKPRVVVIGNGMVGHRFCEDLLSVGNGVFDITVLGEEPRPAYDRVRLTAYFESRDPESLAIGTVAWYAERGIDLRTGTRATRIDTQGMAVHTVGGDVLPYEYCVIATGSYPFVPPVPGIDKEGVFVYRTIEDLEKIIAYAAGSKSAAVIGGGLLGLEAAKAVKDLGLETHVIEFAPRLMPRQLDEAGSELLRAKIEEMDVSILLNHATEEVAGNGKVQALQFKGGAALEVDMVVVSAGIRPRDDVARESGITVHERGGVVVDDQMRTDAENVFAIGEVALHRGMIYGLVAPGYEMAKCAASVIAGQPASFEGGDLSAKLKLLGVDVASFGDPFVQEGSQSVEYKDATQGVYKRIIVSADGTKLLGGILVGDASDYMQLAHYARSGDALPCGAGDLLLGERSGAASAGGLGESMQVCSCNNVTVGQIQAAIADNDIAALGPLKECTRAGTGCGGCLPLVTRILDDALKASGKGVKRALCAHFDFTRQELFQLVRVKRYKTYEELLENHGTGAGCEICKPAVASIMASLWNASIINEDHMSLQDTNDRFLANIQRKGVYSVVPRIPGGEITPEKLIVLGKVAKKYGLYTKITGGQRIDLFGAPAHELPAIWGELVEAGFESGHAYGKALRTVKSCVGSTWCRFGVQDSMGLAIRVEDRYKGIRAPHKIKMAVSGCVRECAEAQGKDVGIIATETGWNLYLCGNGGARPRHAELFATDLDERTVIRYIDRFLMYYIYTADKLMRTAAWVEGLEGGLDHVKEVVIEDSLGICDQLEADMARLVKSYRCEWAEVVKDPEKQKRFSQFANDGEDNWAATFVPERGQKRPADWPDTPWLKPEPPAMGWEATWFDAGAVERFPMNGSAAVRYGETQIAVFNFKGRSEWYATQNMCPHKREVVLARGLTGDDGGVPKVACPVHKKTFALDDGRGLSDPELSVYAFPVKVESGRVYVMLPPAPLLAEQLAKDEAPCEMACTK